MQFSASLAASSVVGTSTSDVAKLHRQKYWTGIPTVRIRSSNKFFFNPANLLVLMSTTTSERVRGSRASDISGMGKMILPWKYGAYLPTISQSYSSGLFCRTFQVARVVYAVVFCPNGIGLSERIGVEVVEESTRAGQIALSLLAARSSGLDGKASLVVSGALRASEGSGEALKRGVI